MAIDIKPIDPVGRPFFAGTVSGIDLTRLLSAEEVAAIHGGMDRFGVLVFHDQHLTDDQQLAFSRQLGPLETATGDIAAPQDRRLGMELGEASVIDEARKFGLTTPIPPYPSIHIGAAAVYPVELVAAYSAFATLGTRSSPVARPVPPSKSAGH